MKEQPSCSGRFVHHSVVSQWVGTERGAVWPVSPFPPLSPYVRLSPHTATACQESITLISCPPTSARIPKPSHSVYPYFEAPDKLRPFALYVAFPRADYYGHADCGMGPRRMRDHSRS